MTNVIHRIDHSTKTFGILIAMVSIVMLFGTFISSFFVLKIRLMSSVSFPGNTILIGVVNTLIIILSSICMLLAKNHYKNDRMINYEIWILWAIMTGILFIGGQLLLWSELVTVGIPFTFGQLSDMVYLMSGAHGIHVIAGLFILYWLQSLSKDLLSLELIQNVGLFWHFLCLIWVILFTVTLV